MTKKPAPRLTLDWPTTIEQLERGAQDERVKPETRAKAAGVARMMRARDRARAAAKERP